MNQSLKNVQPDNQLAMQVGGWGIEITFNVGYKRIYIYLKDLSLFEKHSMIIIQSITINQTPSVPLFMRCPCSSSVWSWGQRHCTGVNIVKKAKEDCSL